VSGDDIVTVLRRLADDGRIGTHYENCWQNHRGCALMAAAAEIERLEAARKQLLNAARGYMDMVCEERDNNERLKAERDAERDTMRTEIDRLRAAGDALAEVVAWWGEGTSTGDAVLAAWEEARRER